jgi:hypothetical protein
MALTISASTITPYKLNLDIWCWTDLNLNFTIEKNDLTGYKARLQCRKDFSSLAIPEFDCTTENGKIIISILNNIDPLFKDSNILVKHSNQITALLKQYKTLEWDIIFISPSGISIKFFYGKMIIHDSATRVDSNSNLTA